MNEGTRQYKRNWRKRVLRTTGEKIVKLLLHHKGRDDGIKIYLTVQQTNSFIREDNDGVDNNNIIDNTFQLLEYLCEIIDKDILLLKIKLTKNMGNNKKMSIICGKIRETIKVPLFILCV